MSRLARAALAATFLTAVSTQAFAQDLVIWWNKSYYPEEDQKFEEIVAQFEKDKGVDVELSFFANEDAPVKALAALTAGNPPDLAFGFLFDLQHTSRWAYEGQLEDVSDVIEPMKDRFQEVALESVYLLNGQTGERSYYAFPTQQQTEHIHVWKSLLDEAGLSVDDIPKTWDDFWSWFCETAQPAVREATGDRRKYGIAQPMSTGASDTIFAFMMFMNAFNGRFLDEEGNVVVDQPENREAVIQALESYTMPMREGCNPPGSVNWQDGDNNVNFLNQVAIMTANPSMSIPASQYTDNPENYNENIVSLEWPDKNDGSPIVYMTAIKTAVIFSDAKNKEGAKDFMRFLYEPENIGPYLEGSLGRWFPVMPELQNTAYWTETDDPHRQIHWRQYMERPQNPFPFVYNHRFIQVMTENAIGKAVGRMVLEDWSAEDAADELIARVKEVVGTD
ncbi:MAG TPA: extracellular solute-binding protein [Geminicoccaceae bacterium]|nr:extracellular solute-binding protein [Geminicoccaceae bacterium]